MIDLSLSRRYYTLYTRGWASTHGVCSCAHFHSCAVRWLGPKASRLRLLAQLLHCLWRLRSISRSMSMLGPSISNSSVNSTEESGESDGRGESAAGVERGGIVGGVRGVCGDRVLGARPVFVGRQVLRAARVVVARDALVLAGRSDGSLTRYTRKNTIIIKFKT